MAALWAIDHIVGGFAVLDFVHNAGEGVAPQGKVPTTFLTTYLHH